MPRKGKRRKKTNSNLDWRVFFLWFLLVVVFIQTLIIRSLWQERNQLRQQVRQTSLVSSKIKRLEKRQGRVISAKERKVKSKVKSKYRYLPVGKSKAKTKPKVKTEQRVSRKPVLRERPKAFSYNKKKKEDHRPYLVIVLDDWGYSDENFPMLEALSLPIDVSVFPDHRYTLEASRLAKKTGKEVMIHLPMEPENLARKNWEDNTITVDITEEEIRKILDEAIESVPYAVGVNNHMGSRATSDLRVMKVVIGYLKKKGLFFLDSVSTPKTVVRKVCRGLGLPYLARDVFIDNQSNLDYIKEQIKRAVRLAKKKGYAVLIGHDRENTLRALIDMETYLRENAKVIKASELFRKLERHEL